MPMSRALIDTGARDRYFTEPPEWTVIFAVAFFFKMHLWSICFSWVYITPSWFASIRGENIIQISFCPISNFGTIWFRGWPNIIQSSQHGIIKSSKKYSSQRRYIPAQECVLLLPHLKTTCLSYWTIWIFCAFPTKTHRSCCVTMSRANWDNPGPIWFPFWTRMVAF